MSTKNKKEGPVPKENKKSGELSQKDLEKVAGGLARQSGGTKVKYI